MLTKSHIMLVKVKHSRRIRLTVPLSLGAFDELIEAFEDLILLFERVFPSWNQKAKKWGLDYMVHHVPMQNFSFGLAFQLIHELFYELRKHKRWKLVEVDTKDVYVSVEFF